MHQKYNLKRLLRLVPRPCAALLPLRLLPARVLLREKNFGRRILHPREGGIRISRRRGGGGTAGPDIHHRQRDREDRLASGAGFGGRGEGFSTRSVPYVGVGLGGRGGNSGTQ